MPYASYRFHGVAFEPVLNIDRLDELRSLIGAEKLAKALRMFEEHLDNARNAVDARDQADGHVFLVAHKLSSAAGALGFEQLATASRTVMTCAPGKPQASELPIALGAMLKAVQDAASALHSVAK